MAARPMPTSTRAHLNRWREPWLDWMVLPTLIVMAVVVGYPIVYMMMLSVQDYNLLDFTPASYVGAGNYATLFSDPIFWQSLGNTAIYTFGSVGFWHCSVWCSHSSRKTWAEHAFVPFVLCC